MKKLLVILLIGIYIITGTAQDIPDLPIAIGAGTAEVWNNQIYHFGGSNNWSGSELYPRIYRFNGTEWTLHDSIPDNNMWDVESVLVGDDVFLLSGWPSGSQLTRKYNMNTMEMSYLSDNPNDSYTWGVTAEYLDGKIYLFLPDGTVHEYTISTDTWIAKSPVEKTGTRDLSSILFNDNIYVIGYNDSTFFRYSPVNDEWTQLSNSVYQVGACAMGIINDLIYCIGGNLNGTNTANYKSVIVYDISANTWKIDSLEISSKRHWMATAEYKGGLYVIGGIDSLSYAVNTVEEIVPQGTAVGIVEKNRDLPNRFELSQNYPNPFNLETIIRYSLPAAQHINLSIYNLLGQKMATLVSATQPAGTYEVKWNASGFNSGVYFARLQSGEQIQVREMLLIK